MGGGKEGCWIEVMGELQAFPRGVYDGTCMCLHICRGNLAYKISYAWGIIDHALKCWYWYDYLNLVLSL